MTASAQQADDRPAASNHQDFRLAWVEHGARSMRGVVARRSIAPSELPVFVGAYGGHLRSAAQIEAKVENYRRRHGVQGPIAYTRATGHNLSVGDQGEELDPTDADGAILPDFAGHLALYVNEPSPGQAQNAALGHNPVTGRPELWLLCPLPAGAEVLAAYGADYERDYDVESSELSIPASASTGTTSGAVEECSSSPSSAGDPS
jgi:hypothetical protein